MKPRSISLLIAVLSISSAGFIRGEIIFRGKTFLEADILVEKSYETVMQDRIAINLSEGPAEELQEDYHAISAQKVTKATYTLSLFHARDETTEIVTKREFYHSPGVVKGGIIHGSLSELRVFDAAYDGRTLFVVMVERGVAFVEAFERVEGSQGIRWNSCEKVKLGTIIDPPEKLRFLVQPNGQIDTSRVQLESSTIVWSEIDENGFESGLSSIAVGPANSNGEEIEMVFEKLFSSGARVVVIALSEPAKTEVLICAKVFAY